MPPKNPSANDKFKVVAILSEIGQLLEVKGFDKFRARAYRNAARYVADYPGDLTKLAAQNRLTEIKGIGAALAGQIKEILSSGRSPYLEKLRAELPAGSIELSKIISLKKLEKLQSTLGITNLEQLKAAIDQDRISEVPGFGKKSAQQLLAAIERYENRGQRLLLLHARRLAEQILLHIQSSAEAREAEVVGAIRRWKETVGTIRIVASARRAPDQLLKHFLELPSITAVEEQTGNSCVVRLIENVRVTFTAVSSAEFAVAVHNETGAKAHVEKMRVVAEEQGFRLNPTTLEKLSSTRGASKTSSAKKPISVKVKTEEDLFSHLGMQYIPPELREDEGEIEMSLAGKLPADLLTLEDIQGMTHCHSTYSDGRNSIEEMALAAEAMGMKYITITDHSPTAFYANGVQIDRLKQQWDEIDRVQEKVKVKLLRGTESDILKEGGLDYPDKILEQFDIIIASIHNRYQLNEDGMTKRVTNAMKNPFFKIWGHPLGRLVQRRPPIPLRVEEVLDVIAESNAVIEINGDPKRLDLEPRWLKEARKRGIKFVVSTDAHSITDLQHLPFGIGLARRAGIRRREVLNTLPVSQFRKQVKPTQ
jgi:DNA polymerase (family 10)